MGSRIESLARVRPAEIARRLAEYARDSRARPGGGLGYESGYNQSEDSWTLESGVKVLHVNSNTYSQSVIEPKVKNTSDSYLTPYFKIRMFNRNGNNLLDVFDCFGDELAPGQTQQVWCHGEGTWN